MGVGLFSDRLVWNSLRSANLRFARSAHATVNYVTLFAVHYNERGLTPPAGARDIIMSENGLCYGR